MQSYRILLRITISKKNEYNKKFLIPNKVLLRENFFPEQQKKVDDWSLQPSNDNDNAVINDRTISRFNYRLKSSRSTKVGHEALKERGHHLKLEYKGT